MQAMQVATNWRQWKVVAYTGKNRDKILGQSFVLADSEQRAMELGRTALRLIGVRGRFLVHALPYFPWRDFAFIGFVAKTDAV